jgi:predicted transport protein
MFMYPIPNGVRDRVISLYSSKTVDKKEILRTVSNIGIYCLSDKVGTFT